MQEWAAVIESALARAMAEKHSTDGMNLTEAVSCLCWAAMRAQRNHPEWAMATLMKRCDQEGFIDELAKMISDGTPIERMEVNDGRF